MTIHEAKVECKLTVKECAAILEMNPRTFEAWDQGRNTPEPYVARLVIAELFRHKKEKRTWKRTTKKKES